MSNVQVTFDTDLNNARSESSLAINPNNLLQVVAASKKFADIHTYNFTLATEYSTDGGQTWSPSSALGLPKGATVMTDPTLAWDDSSNVFLVGLTGYNPPTWNTIGIVIYKSSDGGQTWSPPNPIHDSPGDDKQWAAGDAYPGSPFRGNVYAIWDNGGLAFARTTDHGASWQGTAGAAAGNIISTGTVYPEITVSDDGTVYVVSTDAVSVIEILASTDGGASFSARTNPATGITSLETAAPRVDGWPVLPGGSFRVITESDGRLPRWHYRRRLGGLQRGGVQDLFRSLDGRRHVVEHSLWPAPSHAPLAAWVPSCHAADGGQRCWRLRMRLLRIWAETDRQPDRRYHFDFARWRDDVRLLRRHRPALESHDRCALVTRRPVRHFYWGLHGAGRKSTGLPSRLDRYQDWNSGALHERCPHVRRRIPQ